jgi:hypothetical protein
MVGWVRQVPDGAEIVLSPAGEASWRVLDKRFPVSDARSLLAYVERVEAGYLVLNLVPPLGGLFEVSSLQDALPALLSLIHSPHEQNRTSHV